MKEFHEGYRREEIQKLLSYLDDPVEKLYVLVGKDSGLRANDILRIKYRHVKKDLEAAPGKQHVHIEFEPWVYERRKAAGLTFLGPNSLHVLKQLIKQGIVSTNSDDF